jgi:hypothetical protein
MSEENQTEAPAAPEVDVQALLRSIDNLERKNKELADEKRKLRKLEELQAELPSGTDVKSLLEFKRNHEQQQLESEGKYTEARQALEEQFREATAKKDQRIAELEARVRELEIISPAATALADVVHDPDMILRTQINREQIEREEDGTVVVVKGYDRTPISEWAKNLPAWMQKQPKPQGSGAPIGRSAGEIPAGTKNPFAAESFNLTEQSRLFKTDRDLYERLKKAAGR